MAVIKAFKVAGVRMWIFSGDHNPPHFHAERVGEWSVKVHFLEAAEGLFRALKPPNARIDGTDRRAIEEGVLRHREALLLEWEACQGN